MNTSFDYSQIPNHLNHQIGNNKTEFKKRFKFPSIDFPNIDPEISQKLNQEILPRRYFKYIENPKFDNLNLGPIKAFNFRHRETTNLENPLYSKTQDKSEFKCDSKNGPDNYKNKNFTKVNSNDEKSNLVINKNKQMELRNFLLSQIEANKIKKINEQLKEKLEDLKYERNESMMKPIKFMSRIICDPFEKLDNNFSNSNQIEENQKDNKKFLSPDSKMYSHTNFFNFKRNNINESVLKNANYLLNSGDIKQKNWRSNRLRKSNEIKYLNENMNLKLYNRANLDEKSINSELNLPSISNNDYTNTKSKNKFLNNFNFSNKDNLFFENPQHILKCERRISPNVRKENISIPINNINNKNILMDNDNGIQNLNNPSLINSIIFGKISDINNHENKTKESSELRRKYLNIQSYNKTPENLLRRGNYDFLKKMDMSNNKNKFMIAKSGMGLYNLNL